MVFCNSVQKLDETLKLSDEIQQEDIAVCEAVQRGLRSVSYDRGRYSVKRENGVHHFHSLWREFMLEADSAPSLTGEFHDLQEANLQFDLPGSARCVLRLSSDCSDRISKSTKSDCRYSECASTPSVSLSPARDRMLLLESSGYPSVSELAEPMLRLGGLRINPSTNGPHRGDRILLA